MSLGLRVFHRPASFSPSALKNCLVKEIFLRAETAIYKLFTFHEPHLCYTVVVITLLPLRIPYSHSHTYSFDGLQILALVTSRFPLLSEQGDERGRVLSQDGVCHTMTPDIPCLFARKEQEE